MARLENNLALMKITGGRCKMRSEAAYEVLPYVADGKLTDAGEKLLEGNRLIAIYEHLTGLGFNIEKNLCQSTGSLTYVNRGKVAWVKNGALNIKEDSDSPFTHVPFLNKNSK